MHDSPTKTGGVRHHQSVFPRVRRARKNMTAKQVGSVRLDDIFGALTNDIFGALAPAGRGPSSCASTMIRPMIITCLYEDVVIGHELLACRDIVRINLSSVWMLANALQAIVAGWNFQLCGDVTRHFSLQDRRVIIYLHTMQEQCPLLVHYSEGDGK